MSDRKVYETQFLLGAFVQSSMGKAFGQVNKNVKGVELQASKSSQAIERMGHTLEHVAEVTAAYMGIHAITDFAKESSAAAQNQIANETKLSVVMKQRMKASSEQVESVARLTESQEKLGIIDHTTQLAGAQMLGTFLHQKTALATLVPAMNNLLAQQDGVNATQESAVNIGKMMGKVFEGQTGALKKAGISFSKAEEQVFKFGNEQQKAAMLAKVITENVGLMNAKLAQTDPGKLKQENNMLEAIKEQIGKKIIPIQTKFAELFLKAVPYIEKMLPILDEIPKALQFIYPIASGILGIITGIFGFIAKHWPAIRPIILGVGTAILFVKTATAALVIQEKAAMVIQSLTYAYNTAAAALALVREGNSLAAVAQLVFNGTLWACPVTWIVAGIAAIAVGAYLLVKNWKAVSTFFGKLWKGLKDNWKDIMLAVFLPFIGVPLLIIKNFDKIKHLFGGKSKPVIQQSVQVQHTSAQKAAAGIAHQASIPKHAAGTSHFAGGLTWAGEKGPELIDAPRGSRILSNQRSKRLVASSQGDTIQIDYHPQYIIQGNADEKVLKTASDSAYDDFKRKYAALQNQNKRLRFAQ
jgi:hypothetical protein